MRRSRAAKEVSRSQTAVSVVLVRSCLSGGGFQQGLTAAEAVDVTGPAVGGDG